MPTLKAKEIGASDSSSLDGSLPNDTDFGVNWDQFASRTSPTRKNAQIESESTTSSIVLQIDSLSPVDYEIRVIGFDMQGVTASGDGLGIYFTDVNTGTQNGYRILFEPNRASAAAKFKLQRVDADALTDLDNSVEAGWSETAGELIDFYLRFDGTTVTARAVQSAQSLDETLSAADSTFAFGTGATDIDYMMVFFKDAAVDAESFELWDMVDAAVSAQVIANWI